MTHEELGIIVLQSKKFKFYKTLIDENLIRFKSLDAGDISLENFELTEKAYALLRGEKEEKSEIRDEFLQAYIDKFKADNIGINKNSFSPKQKVRKKLESFFKKYKTDEQSILDAVDYYHKKMYTENKIQYSLDAQYFIEKDGGSLLLDMLTEAKEENNYNTQSYTLV
jgi:hypothetical protein